MQTDRKEIPDKNRRKRRRRKKLWVTLLLWSVNACHFNRAWKPKPWNTKMQIIFYQLAYGKKKLIGNSYPVKGNPDTHTE